MMANNPPHIGGFMNELIFPQMGFKRSRIPLPTAFAFWGFKRGEVSLSEMFGYTERRG